jgi:hypothetical protein
MKDLKDMHTTVLGNYVEKLRKQHDDLYSQLEEASVEYDERLSHKVPDDVLAELKNKMDDFINWFLDTMKVPVTIDEVSVRLGFSGGRFYVKGVHGFDVRNMLVNEKDMKELLGSKSEQFAKLCEEIDVTAEKYGVYKFSLWYKIDPDHIFRYKFLSWS